MPIKFKCGNCGEDYELDDSAAGQTAECQCGAEFTVPSPEAEPPPPPLPLQIRRQEPPQAQETVQEKVPAQLQVPVEEVAGGTPDLCPKCKNAVKPDAVICVNCGHNLKLGMNVKTIAKAKTVGSFGIALGVCLAASILSGLLWAGIAILLKLEIGWIAIGVGIITGIAPVIFTEERSMRLGLAAASLAIIGLLLGKLLTANYFFKHDFEDMLRKDPAILKSYVWNEAEQNKEIQIPAELSKWLDENDPEESPVPENLKAAYDSANGKVESKISSMKKEDKERLYKSAADKLLGQISFFTRITAMLRAWDVLWFALAVGAAWKIGTGNTDE